MWNWTKGQLTSTVTINCLNLVKNYNDTPKVCGSISSARKWEAEQQEAAVQHLWEYKTGYKAKKRLGTPHVSSQEKSWQYLTWIRGYMQLFVRAIWRSIICSLKYDLFCFWSWFSCCCFLSCICVPVQWFCSVALQYSQMQWDKVVS